MMSRMCSLHPVFLTWLSVLVLMADSITLQPIFDPRLNLAPGAIPSRTPSSPTSLIRVPAQVAGPIIEAQPVVVLPIMSRRQPHKADNRQEDNEDLLSPEPEPTCDELKTMWRKMRRISRQMELTNEVPKLRDPFVGGAYDFRPSKYPSANPYSKASKSSRIRNVFHSNGLQSNSNNLNKFEVSLGPKPGSKNFGQVIRDQDEHLRFKNQISPGLSSGDSFTYRRPSSRLGFDDFDSNDYSKTSGFKSKGRVPGRFSNFPLPEEALGVYGTVVNSPEEKARFRSRTRRPPESSFRTRIVGMDRALSRGRIPFRATKPHGEYHYGSVITHYPNDRSGGVTPAGNGGGGGGNIGGSSMYHNPPDPGFAEFPTEVNQRFDNNAVRVERFDKIQAAKIKTSCYILQNKPCKTDVDCYCMGNPKFFCGGNQCRLRFKPSKFAKKPLRRRHLYYIENPYDEPDVVELYDAEKDPIWPASF